MMNPEIERLEYVWGLYFSRLSDTPLVRPKSVTLTLTSRCNLRCVMCNHWSRPTSPSAEMTTEQAGRLIDEAAAWGVPEVELAGGEPMVRKDFAILLDRAAGRGLGVNIVTNGVLIRGDLARRLARVPRLRLQISIDGHTPGLHDAIRGRKGSFEKTMAGARLLRELSGGRLPLNATTVVLSKNAAHLHEIAAGLRDAGFSSITFQPIVDDNLNLFVRDPDNPLRPRGRTLAALDLSIRKLVAFRAKRGFVANSPENLGMIARYYREGIGAGEVQCYSGFTVAIVAPDGMLWFCKGNAGSVFRRGLRQRWFSREARLMRRKIRLCASPCLYPCFLDGDAQSPVEASKRIIGMG